jgi:nucleotide-binding universal stress UspA family protein
MGATGVDRVVVGISGSLGNLAALHAGVAQARRSGAVLVAVVACAPVDGLRVHRRRTAESTPEPWHQRAQDTLIGAFTEAFGGPPHGVQITSVIARGFAGSVLVNEASRAGDLLVVGSGRPGRLARIRRGSVRRYCLAHARCPVLAVPQPDMISELRAASRAWRRRDLVPATATELGEPFSRPRT